MRKYQVAHKEWGCEYFGTYPPFIINSLFLFEREFSLQILKNEYCAVIEFFRRKIWKAKTSEIEYFQITKTDNLHGSMRLSTIERWCRIIGDTAWIILFKWTACPRTVRSKANIRKMKQRYDQWRVFSCRKTARDLRRSRTNAQRILKDELKL